MEKMSRRSCREYLGRMRGLYAEAARRRKGELLTEMQKSSGLERQYLNKLMTGNR